MAAAHPLVPLAVAGCIFLVAMGACGEGAPRGATTVVDSAGVRLTTSRDDPGRIFAAVDTTPLLSVGGSGAEGAAQFYRVQRVWVDGEGNVWVADGQSAELRIFRPDGTHWTTVGRRGQGPGEFLQPQLLGSFRGDSVALWDQGNARLTVLDERAEIGRITRLESGDRAVPKAYDVFEDGSLLVQFPRLVPPPTPGTILRDSARLERLDLEPARSIAEADVAGPLWLWTGRNQVPLPFTINPGFDVEGAGVHLVSGPDFRVTVYEEGRVREIYGLDRPARNVGSDDLDAYARMTRGSYPEDRVDEYLDALDHPSRPGRLPAWSDILLSDDGKAWARVYAPDPSAAAWWDVFGPDRRWLGRVETPGSLRVMQVVRGMLAGVWYDDLGTESVRLYGFLEAVR